MKPTILVIYYSQSGQLRHILERLVVDIVTECDIEFLPIQPVRDFPFPWNAYDFFDAMPECVQQIPEEIYPLKPKRTSYDCVLLGWQPWFLSPSLPITSFLKSPFADILHGQKVISVCGSRNMWLNAHEKIKEGLIACGAEQVGNLVLFDRNPNLTSVLTVIRWTFKGQKEASRWLPAAGVQDEDIRKVNRFGPLIASAVRTGVWNQFQQNFLERGAIELKPGLIVLEQRAIKNFRKFSLFILSKGKRGENSRRPAVLLFKRLLLIGVFILSPISQFTAGLKTLFQRRKLNEEVEYFKNIEYKQNAL